MRGRQSKASFGAVPIDIMNVSELVAAVADDVTARRPTVYAGLYAASFHLAAHEAEYRQLLWQTRNYPDGAGVVWALGRQRVAANRTALTDTIHDLLRVGSRRGWRIFLYGGTPEVNEQVAALIASTYPGCEIVGTRHGYEELLPETIASARPDLTLVARGPIRQERWAVDASRYFTATGSAI